MPFKTLTKWKISKKITLSPKGESECNIYLQITLLCSFFLIIIPTWSIFFRLQNWWEKTEPFVSVVLRFKLCYIAYQSPLLLAQPEPRLFSAIVLSIIKLTFLPLSSNALCCQVGHMGHLCPKENRIYYRPI